MDLLQVRRDVLMRQHHPLWQPRRPRRVHKERDLLSRIHLGLAEPCRPRDVPDARKVLEARVLHPPVPNQDDPVARQSHQAGGLYGHRQQLGLRGQRPGVAVPQLERQLVGRVRGVGGRDGAAGPEGAKGDSGGVDAVGREEGEDIAALPVPERAEALAEVEGGGLEGRVGVLPRGVRVGEEGLVVGVVALFALEEEGEDVLSGDLEWGVLGGGVHGGSSIE